MFHMKVTWNIVTNPTNSVHNFCFIYLILLLLLATVTYNQVQSYRVNLLQ